LAHELLISPIYVIPHPDARHPPSPIPRQPLRSHVKRRRARGVDCFGCLNRIFATKVRSGHEPGREGVMRGCAYSCVVQRRYTIAPSLEEFCCLCRCCRETRTSRIPVYFGESVRIPATGNTSYIPHRTGCEPLRIRGHPTRLAAGRRVCVFANSRYPEDAWTLRGYFS